MGLRTEKYVWMGEGQPQAIVLDSIEAKAKAALVANAAFVAIASPSTAQNAAQIKALTRQMNAVIRILLEDFTSDT